MKDTRRKERRAMPKHMTGTRKEWLAARLELLEAEEELTRRSDELARRRQELPGGRIGKEDRGPRGMGTRDGDQHARGVPHLPRGGAKHEGRRARRQSHH